MGYAMYFSITSGVAPTENQIKIAAQQSVLGLGTGFDQATISKVVEPSFQNGLWNAEFGFTIPATISQTTATTRFTSQAFSTDLRSKLTDQKLEGIKITQA